MEIDKLSKEEMNAGILLGLVNATVKKFRSVHAVEVVAWGTAPMYWDESQVRAFQIIMHNANDDMFKFYKENVIIYSGQTRHERMIFRRDGKFENEFEGGFFDGTANMAFEIL